MNSAVNILNLQTAPAQTRVSKQNPENTVSFLNLLQKAANYGRAEITENNNFLKTDEKINDINNVQISSSENGESVLAKVLNGETEDLAGIEDIDIVEEIKKEVAEIVVRDNESEKVDVSKILEILGAPAEIIAEIIAAIIEPEIIPEDTREPVQEISAVNKLNNYERASNNSETVTDNSEIINEPVLISIGEAENFMAEVSEYIYSERIGEIVRVEAMPEQVQENIADFAGLIEETGDFKNAVASYAAEKIEANNAAGTVMLDAENIKEVITQVLNKEPELEIVSAVRTSGEKPVFNNLLEISSAMKMRGAVNITQVQPEAQSAAAIMEAEIIVHETAAQFETSEPVIINNGETVREEATDEPVAEISVADVQEANNVELYNAPGIFNAGVADVQSQEINIAIFSSDIAQVITERAQSILLNLPAANNGAEVFELRLRLKPEALGEVFLRIAYKDGNVGLNIIAANAAAERAILSQMGELREILSAQEINLTGFDINSFSQNEQRQNNRNNNGRASDLNNNISEVRAQEEAERREAVANYIRSRRIFYKTI